MLANGTHNRKRKQKKKSSSCTTKFVGRMEVSPEALQLPVPPVWASLACLHLKGENQFTLRKPRENTNSVAGVQTHDLLALVETFHVSSGMW